MSEQQVRKAFEVANELMSHAHGDERQRQAAFECVFNAMLAGTFANPSHDELIQAVNNLSNNLGKWLGDIAEAVAHCNPGCGSEAEALEALKQRLKASHDKLQSAVDAQQPEL